MLIFKLLRRHAKNRVHEQKSDSSGASNGSPPIIEESIETFAGKTRKPTAERAIRELSSSPPPPPALTQTQVVARQQVGAQLAAIQQQEPLNQSDGVYRVPFSTRFVIGPGSRSAKNQYFGPLVGGLGSSFVANSFTKHHSNNNNNNNEPRQATFEADNGNDISSNKPLYCWK